MRAATLDRFFPEQQGGWLAERGPLNGYHQQTSVIPLPPSLVRRRRRRPRTAAAHRRPHVDVRAREMKRRSAAAEPAGGPRRSRRTGARVQRTRLVRACLVCACVRNGAKFLTYLGERAARETAAASSSLLQSPSNRSSTADLLACTPPPFISLSVLCCPPYTPPPPLNRALSCWNHFR